MNIKATWDDEAKVWVVVNDELGIATEAETVEALLQKLEAMIPELLELNSNMANNLPINLQAERTLILSHG